jgi:uncharacterized protein YcbX
MSYFLSELAIYPIKSIQGISLKTSQVNESGLLGDRRYMLVNSKGLLITGREQPKLTLVKAERIGNEKWKLSHPDIETSITIDSTCFLDEHKEVIVWDDKVQAQLAHNEINIWFSQIINNEVQLVFFGSQSTRYTNRRPESPVAFADGYPFLLTTQGSLDELNKSCPEDIKMAQFRPNLVVNGNKAFDEDSWKRIRIGEVEFENVKPCERCIFITLNPETAERLKKGEPLKTLGKFRLLEGKGINFGINLVALNTGVIRVDDKVEILEYQEPDTYKDKR